MTCLVSQSRLQVRLILLENTKGIEDEQETKDERARPGTKQTKTQAQATDQSNEQCASSKPRANEHASTKQQ